MILKRHGDYVLRQIPGHDVIYITTPDKDVILVRNCKLTDENIPKIIAELKRPEY